MRTIKKFIIRGSVIGIIILFLVNATLPKTESVLNFKFEPYIIFKDSKGDLIASHGDIKYTDITNFDHIPPNVVNALISLEDKRFWSHFGIDILGIFRALCKNIIARRIVEGGSTITQQLAKNVILNQEGKVRKSYTRKIREALLALKLEYKFTKKQIMTMYLNNVYFGSRTYGIKAACWKYFGKHLDDITLFESACLIGMLKAPSRYASNTNKLTARVEHILKQMLEQKYINQSEYEIAALTKSKFMHVLNHDSIYYFTDWIVNSQIPTWISDMKINLEIQTTIDMDLQKHAYQSSQQIYKKYSKAWNMENTSLLAINYDGQVKAMIGGSKYSSGCFNRATKAFRQTGSVFKFFVYLEALRQNIPPHVLIDDSCPNVDGWEASNYFHVEKGFLPMSAGLIQSINGITVRVAKHVGTDNIIDLAYSLGLSTTIPQDLSISLGSSQATLLELVRAFSAIPNRGMLPQVTGIIKIKNSDTNETLVDFSNNPKTKVLDEDPCKQLGSMLHQVIVKGTGKRIKLKYPAAGKTGSSQLYRDFWFVGFTPHLIIGTWCGNDDYLQSMTRKFGPNPSVILWKEFALNTQPDEDQIQNWTDFFQEDNTIANKKIFLDSLN